MFCLFRPVFVIYLSAFLFFTFPVAANAETNPAGVRKLETLFNDLLTRQQGNVQSKGGELLIDGNVMIEQADFYYAVTLPALTATYPDSSTIKIGMIAVNVMPTSEPDVWKMTVALPTPISFYKSPNAPELLVHFGSQNFAGIWHEKIHNFSKFDARYENIEIESSSLKAEMKIPDISASMTLEEDENGLWSGPVHYSAKGTSVEGKDGALLTIGDIKLDMNIKDYNIAKALDYQEQFSSLSESYEEGDMPSDNEGHYLAIYNLVTGAIGNIWDNVSLDMAVEDFSMTSAPDDEEQRHLKLSRAGFGFSAGGFRSNSLSIGTKVHYSGLKLSPLPESYKNTTPTDVNIDISLNKLPYKELTGLGQQSLKTILTNPAMGKMAGLQALIMAPTLLTQAGSNLTIADSFLGNEGYTISLGGVATANIQAIKGGTAKARADIYGMDTLLGYLAENMKAEDLSEEDAATIEKNMMSLEMLKLLGVSTQNKNGKMVLRYDIEVTQDGQILLNDRDLMQALSDEE